VSDLEDALAALAAGRPVVLPTDTVYGLAASLDVEDAVAALFRIKGRPRAKAIPVLGASAGDLERIVSFDERARAAAALWPGPMTIVLPRAPGFDVDLGGTDDGTVAVRVPAHPIALEVLERAGPLAVTSANVSGRAPAASAAGARAAVGAGFVVVDGGTCDGEPSTVIDLTSAPRVLRQGALGAEKLQFLMS
jgi:L-threonylcarbamoyladenylate synthase